MRKVIFFLIVVSLSIPLYSVPSDAGPAWGKHKKKNKYKYKGEYEVDPFGKMVAKKPEGVVWVKGGPPPWAPAHGYRRKKKYSRGTVTVYKPPYGVDLGRCNRSEINEVLGGIAGGVAGGVMGSQIGKGDGKTAATIGGAILGYLVGSTVGRELDQLDQACVGQALEHARTHQTVAWRNSDRNTTYEVTPTEIFRGASGEYCREYYSIATVNGRMKKVYGTACRQSDGTWKLIN